jgi:hypothetical protein
MCGSFEVTILLKISSAVTADYHTRALKHTAALSHTSQKHTKIEPRLEWVGGCGWLRDASTNSESVTSRALLIIYSRLRALALSAFIFRISEANPESGVNIAGVLFD